MNMCIYGILDSHSRQIVYIGKSSSIHTRMSAHKQKWNEATCLALRHGVIPPPINQSVMTCFAFLALDARRFAYVILEKIENTGGCQASCRLSIKKHRVYRNTFS